MKKQLAIAAAIASLSIGCTPQLRFSSASDADAAMCRIMARDEAPIKRNVTYNDCMIAIGNKPDSPQ